MYARSVKDGEGSKTLTLTVSGMLWRRSLVMEDEETGTLWSHLLGRGMKGELEGTQLKELPSEMTTWAAWKRLHPKTSVIDMSRTSGRYVVQFQKQPKRFVFGLRSGEKAHAYPLDRLKKKPIVNDTFLKRKVLVTFDAENATARGFLRTLDDEALEFAAVDGVPNQMKDSKTESIWSSETGQCLSGDLKGKQLEPLAGVPSFRKAWFAFYPESTEYR